MQTSTETAQTQYHTDEKHHYTSSSLNYFSVAFDNVD